MKDLLSAAVEEERQLMERLEAVRAVIRAYGGTPRFVEHSPGRHVPSEPRQRGSRSPSERTEKIKALARNRMRAETRPIPTRELVAFLDAQGVEIGGKNQISTLSALLSNAGEFKPVGRRGWLLKMPAPDVTLTESGTLLSGLENTSEKKEVADDSQSSATIHIERTS